MHMSMLDDKWWVLSFKKKTYRQNKNNETKINHCVNLNEIYQNDSKRTTFNLYYIKYSVCNNSIYQSLLFLSYKIKNKQHALNFPHTRGAGAALQILNCTVRSWYLADIWTTHKGYCSKDSELYFEYGVTLKECKALCKKHGDPCLSVSFGDNVAFDASLCAIHANKYVMLEGGQRALHKRSDGWGDEYAEEFIHCHKCYGIFFKILTVCHFYKFLFALWDVF